MPYEMLPGDLRMHYYLDDYTDPWRIDVETVLFHHGNSRSGRLWFGWVPALARDYRLIRIDGRGFGLSTVPAPGYPYSLEQSVTDVLNLLDRLGIPQVHWIGDTYGSAVGLKFCHDHPERAITLTGCEPTFNISGVVRYLPLIRERGVEEYARATQFFDTPEHTDWHTRQIGKTPLHVTLETIEAMATVDLEPILPEITTPTLLIIGEGARRDPDVPTAEGHGNSIIARTELMTRLMPNARMERIEGNDGRPQFIRPEECARRWRAFVKSV